MTPPRLLALLSLASWLSLYCLGFALWWLVYLFVVPALLFGLAALALVAKSRPRDRAALGMLVLGPSLAVLPAFVVAGAKEAQLVPHDVLFDLVRGPLAFTLATSPAWAVALSGLGAWFFRRSATLTEPALRRLARVLFAVGVPGWFLLPSTLLLLRLGFGFPSAGLYLAVLVGVAARAQVLSIRCCRNGTSSREVRAFSAWLAAAASATLLYTSFLALVAALGQPTALDVIRPYSPLVWEGLGAPLIAITTSWLGAAAWLYRLSSPP